MTADACQHMGTAGGLPSHLRVELIDSLRVSATPTPGVVGIATLRRIAFDLPGLFG